MKQGAELPALSPRSFCWQHRPAQRLRALQQGPSLCVICLEAVARRPCYDTLVCPACTSAWFHRRCIQVGDIAPQHHPNLCGGYMGPPPNDATPAPGPGAERGPAPFPLPALPGHADLPGGDVSPGHQNPRQVSIPPPASASLHEAPWPVPSCLPRVPLIPSGLSCPRLLQGRCLGGGQGFRGSSPAAQLLRRQPVPVPSGTGAVRGHGVSGGGPVTPVRT